jgi:hypothetical protein
MWFVLVAATCAGCLGVPSVTVAARLSTANVMAPLDLDSGDRDTNWREFRTQLQIAKTLGVNAVSSDVWWGKVEKEGDNQFDWRYYDRILHEIEAAGLHWVPIMSFHQCGGNVGDECDIPIPRWIWTHYEREGVPQRALQYKSERDKFNGETVSLWEDHIVMRQYIELMQAFQEHFAAKAGIIDEINLSLGPAGELRYPSYNAHDDTHDGRNCGFPTRGCFQAYSDPARADFRAFVLARYQDLSGVNTAWKDSLGDHPLRDTAEIGPPDDNDNSTFRAQGFVARGDYQTKQYGRDFVDWYNHALVEHGRRMIQAAIGAFNGSFRIVPIGVKMPGVHWQMMANAAHPRIAEITAGLIQTSLGDLQSRVRGYGYENILNMLATFKDQRNIVLHFTCLEKDDDERDGLSLAKTLVFWVSQAAQDRGVSIKGENALSGGVQNEHGWDNIENVFQWATYNGLTVLRIANVTTGSDIGQRRYRDFITKCKTDCDFPR